MKRLLISLAFALCASSLAAQTTLRAGESSPVTLPLWNVLTMTGTGATCVQTRLSDTPGSGQSQGSNAISGSAVVTVGPYATVTRHTISCSVGSLVFDNAPAAFVVTGGLLASDIDASDTPADEECLTYDSTGPALEWQTCGSGGGLTDGDYGDVAVSGSGTVLTVESGTATTAGALAANGGNCTAGSYPLGVDASGAAESCTAVAGTEASALAPAVVIEGATADAYEGNVVFTDPTADWTWTWSGTGGVSGVPSITGGTSGSSTLTLDGDSSVSGAVTIGADGSLTSPNGTAAVPSVMGADADSGIFFADSGTSVRITKNGLARFGMIGDNLFFDPQLDIGGYQDLGLGRHNSGVAKFTNTSSQIRGLIGGGAAVASATALPVPTGNVFHVTGTTTITSITATNLQSGVCFTMIFDDALTLTDGSNLKLNGDFVTTADDTIPLCFDGTNFYESGARSVN